MKKLYYLMMAMAATLGCTSCNNEWEDEQFVQMASLKAVPGDDGVTPVYLRYNTDGEKVYERPVLISGSTLSEKSHVVHVVLDEDTLEQLNKERYGEREELHYKLLDGQYYSFPETVEVPAGEAQAILPINFTLGGKDNQHPLDLSDKWILPLTVAEDRQSPQALPQGIAEHHAVQRLLRHIRRDAVQDLHGRRPKQDVYPEYAPSLRVRR